MKYSYNWLKDLSGTTLSAQEVAEAITMHSFEVEEMENVGSDFEKVVVGEIVEIEKHPNADKLQVTKTDVGGQVLQIVCGARNIAVGDKVPVALVGAKLGEDFVIKETEIRGVKSFGMICAEDELGLGTDHNGIMQLDSSIEAGTKFSEVVSGPDTVLEIKILPDRAHDALSHVGMAREIAALSGAEMDYDYDGLVLPERESKKVSVAIDERLCSRYIAVVLENVTVEQSPEWLRSKLERCGIRSINNVVDVTNFVMLELGQPMHAFDFDTISSGDSATISVRSANSDEMITILDGSQKKLTGADIVIANRSEAIALAGVMGGEHTGVGERTQTVVLEAATFDPVSIRKTRQRLNLPTDAAMRFEKEIDPNLAEKAMVRAVELLEHLAGAKFEGIAEKYPHGRAPFTLELDLTYIDKLLGTEVPHQESARILRSLGYGVEEKTGVFAVTVPTFRLDTLSQEDLIEEIGRIYGYEKIQPKPLLAPVVVPKTNERRMFTRKAKDILVSLGYSEILSYAFYGKREIELFHLQKTPHLEVEMPLSPDLSFMRVSMLPGMLRAVSENLKRFGAIRIFETGKVYWPREGGLPTEKTMLLGAVVLEDVHEKQKKTDKRAHGEFYVTKGDTDALLEKLGIAGYYYDDFKAHPLEDFAAAWHGVRTAEIKLEAGNKTIGFVGEVHPRILDACGITKRVAVFEFDLDVLQETASEELTFAPISRFPEVTRDLSMIVNGDILADDIMRLIEQKGGEMVLNMELFDIFDFDDGSASYAFHIIFGSPERTLTGSEVDARMESIMEGLAGELGIEVRRS